MSQPAKHNKSPGCNNDEGNSCKSAGQKKQQQQQHDCSTISIESDHDTGLEGGWEYVYLRTDKDSEGQLVELHDTQDHCSTVSTVLGNVGFNADVHLAVPTCLLPVGASPVICGNTIELGDWDIACADSMAPATSGDLPELDGFTFFSGNVGSSYCEADEVCFRFAIVWACEQQQQQQQSRKGSGQILCWEGPFLRRVSEYAQGGGFLVFGRPELVAFAASSGDVLAREPLLAPGWLTQDGQVALLVRLDRPEFPAPPTGRRSSRHRQEQLQALPVELRVTFDPPCLAPNYRGPLLVPPATGFGRPGHVVAVRYPAGAAMSVEFVRLAPSGVTEVALDVSCRFFDGSAVIVEAAASTRLVVSLPEGVEEVTSARLELGQASEDWASACLLAVQVRRLHCCGGAVGLPEAIRSLDRWGAGVAPPLASRRPIRVDPLPQDWASVTDGPASNHSPGKRASSGSAAPRFYELPVTFSQEAPPPGGGSVGVGCCRASISGGGGGAKDSATRLSRLSSDVGLIARLVATPPSVDSAADALLSLLQSACGIASERWAMMAAPSLAVCAALCLKQARLPVAYVASGRPLAAELDACRYYGVRAVVAPAADIRPDLLAAAAERGLAVYAYGRGLQAENLLEGVFSAGTFAELDAQ